MDTGTFLNRRPDTAEQSRLERPLISYHSSLQGHKGSCSDSEQVEDKPPLSIADRHHRESRKSDQVEVCKLGAVLDLLQGGSSVESPEWPDGDNEQFFVVLIGIWIGITHGFSQPNDRLLISGVIDQDLISDSKIAEVLESK